MSYREKLDFMIFDWLRCDELFSLKRFSDHSRETFDAVFDTCEKVARTEFAPHNRTADLQEPALSGDTVILPDCAKTAFEAYRDAGMLAAGQDYQLGGMQLPYCGELAANGFFIKDSVGLWGGALLTVGNANLLLAHATDQQIEVFATNEINGRFAGTMCLSEPDAGSSLGDITTRALADGEDFECDPLGARHRLRGNKMWISCGDHELTENIVHLVLAKIPDHEGKLVPGSKGISLFIVPKFLVTPEGRKTGERNDVVVSSLNHKMGYRGAPNTALNFGEGAYRPNGKDGAIGYLVGKPGDGLKCMFHMMNEARIGVGYIATMLGQAGLEDSTTYARERRQGRHVGHKDPTTSQVAIMEHADVRRMLLTQKAYCDGALALCLYSARMIDQKSGAVADEAQSLSELLDLLTPIVKSWPSRWCLEANNLAIQVLGGAGYTRDFQVEQYWRDNRLNMIHEGTNGIQGLDLLGRKVAANDGRALDELIERMLHTLSTAASSAELANYCDQLANTIETLRSAVHAVKKCPSAERGLANSSLFLEGLGHIVVAWLFLDMLVPIIGSDDNLHSGIRAAGLWFFEHDLPAADHWLRLVAGSSDIPFHTDPDWL